MKNCLIIIFLALIALSNAQYDYDESYEDERIFGGVDARSNVRYVASLQDYAHKHLCGGGILNERFILTSAYCVRLKPQFVYVGSTSLKTLIGFNITNTFVRYNNSPLTPETMYDIGLIQTQEYMTQKLLKLSFLELPDKDIVDFSELTVSGWGYNAASPSNVNPDKLQSLKTRAISNRECGIRYKYNKTVIPPHALCTYHDSEQKGACAGDEGSPLVVGQIVYGIVYYTYRCGDPQFPEINTRVFSVVAWIANTINKHIYK